MKYFSPQNPRGILWFGWISIGILLCILIVWFLMLREYSLRGIDQTLYHKVQESSALYRTLATHNTASQIISTEITRCVPTDPWKVQIEICDTNAKPYIKTGIIDSAVSLSSLDYPSLEQPTTLKLANNVSYRIYSQAFEGFYVYAATPLPSSWDLIIHRSADLPIVLPLLTVLLATIGIWSFVRLHQPIQRLDKYLQTLIQQPLGKELLKPPLPPKGDVYKLTQTVSKIVERLHASRNQALQFSSFASHELRTPLSIIRNQLESALTSHVKAKELRGTVASAYDEMLRLNRAVEDLLSLGTMQAGTLTLDLETISLSKFLNRFYDEALFLSRPKNITVVLKKGPDVYLKGDVIRLRQVFFNLLDNAIKNMSPGKRIRLIYTIKDKHVVILFADTGVGIAPDKLEKIFEPFFTFTKKSGTRQGTGIGLALVKWIIELHRGTIAVSSEIDKGTEFAVSLPYERVIEKR